MQRYIIAFLFLCLHTMARGQTDDAPLYYWFDSEHETLYSDSTGSGQWKQMVDVSQLKVGLHTFYVITTDSKGRVSTPEMRQFYKIDQSADGEQFRCLCYVDGEMFCQKEVSANGGLIDMELDAKGLSEGMHRIQLQVLTASGVVSGIHNGFFLRTATAQELGRLRCMCYVDGMLFSEESVSAKGGVLNMNLDASRLTEGLHNIQMQVITETGVVSGVYNGFFIRKSMEQEIGEFRCLCYVDGELFSQEKMPAEGGLLALDLDANSLTEGLHRIQLQVMTKSGIISGAYNGFFLRIPTQEEQSNYSCIYAVDDETESHKLNLVGNDGVYHFDLDMSRLSDGLHHISYFLSSDKGVSSSPQTRFFIKLPTGGNAIARYQYWLNDDFEGRKDITLPKPQNPLKLISLLPIDAAPLRSSQFHFEMKGDQPKMYAMNDFHVRFYDASGRFTDACDSYIDYSVGQTVENITDLQSTQALTSPANNEVVWYKFEVMKGDSIALKSDKACTIQVFSATGEELLSSKGSESVVFRGTHIRKDGTFYVAVHDVTAVNATSLILSYEHIDKYSVLNYTPEELGVLPCGQVIVITGNGYDKLKSAVLRYGDITIEAEAIYTSSKSEAELLFVLQGNEPKGLYDLVLAFEDDGEERVLVKPQAIKLAVPDFADFKIEITDPRTIGSPYPVSVNITNVGNITYSNIPFFIAYDNVEKITDMCFLNFEIEADSLLVENGLKFVYDIENFKGRGKNARMFPMVIPILRPNETVTFKLGFTANNHVTYNVYGWAGTPWNLYAHETMSAIHDMVDNEDSSSGESYGSGNDGTSDNNSGTDSSVRVTLPGGYGDSSVGRHVSGGIATSCMPDPCDLAGIVGDMSECLCGTALGLGTTLGGIQLALMNRHNAAQRELLEESGLFDNPHEYFPSYQLPHPGEILRNWAGHCLSGKAGQVMSTYNTIIDMMGEDDCGTPVIHSCNQFNPGDPNDIFGYIAESGSRYIPEGTTDVYYTIEFENDPEIANASAHTIIVRDTLDTSHFDLSTFTAKSVKIGDALMEIDGVKNITKRTMDLRPDINVIAQISLTLNEQDGVATWIIESLDPMTMEPTEDAMQGVLPVNVNGSGIGEVSYNISLKPGLSHGSEVNNRAGIVFDNNEVIMTPTWTNIIDAIAPVGRITGSTLLSDSTICVNIEASDEGSGAWRYDVYAQYGAEAPWWKVAENVPIDSAAVLKVFDDIDYGFYVVVTDSAGNVEQKAAEREYSFMKGLSLVGDVNGDGVVNIADAAAVLNVMAGNSTRDGDVNGDGVVNIADVAAVLNIMAGK